MASFFDFAAELDKQLNRHDDKFYEDRGYVRFQSNDVSATTPTKTTPTPNAVYRDEKKGATTILWSDGKKTTVVPNDTEKSDIFTGFCIAYTKRILGSTSNIERAIDACVWSAGSKKRARETANENRKMAKAIKREEERLLREKKIQEEIERLRIMDEAASRYSNELADKVAKGTGK